MLIAAAAIGYWLYAKNSAGTTGTRAAGDVAAGAQGGAGGPAGQGANSGGKGGQGGPAGGGNRPLPVIAQEAKKGDMDVYLSALGSVAPQNSVTVRARVDGQLMRVAFRKGQMVKAGDVLAEIDPRPFQVQLASPRWACRLRRTGLSVVRAVRDHYGAYAGMQNTSSRAT